METHDIVILGTIIAISNGLVVLGDRLWKKKPDEKPEQSVICGFQHTTLQKSIDSQTDSLKDMVSALRSMVEDSRLRHQIVCDKLDRLHEMAVRNHREQ